MTEKVTRTLRGGPLDGAEDTWSEGRALIVAHLCPDPDVNPASPYDQSLYDEDGNYVWSQHAGDVTYRPCGKCDLCPGHLVDVAPGERYQWTGPALDQERGA